MFIVTEYAALSQSKILLETNYKPKVPNLTKI